MHFRCSPLALSANRLWYADGKFKSCGGDSKRVSVWLQASPVHGCHHPNSLLRDQVITLIPVFGSADVLTAGFENMLDIVVGPDSNSISKDRFEFLLWFRTTQ